MGNERRDTMAHEDEAARELSDLGPIIRRKEAAEADSLEPAFIDTLRRRLLSSDRQAAEGELPQSDSAH